MASSSCLEGFVRQESDVGLRKEVAAGSVLYISVSRHLIP